MLSGSRRKSSKMESPDVTFIFAEDVLEWDAYLARQLEGVNLYRQQIERMAFPLGVSRAHLFNEARVVLVILSPALVRFLDSRASDCVQLTRLLRPARTIAMLCGATAEDLSAVKNVMISYDEWRHLEAKDKDINMVRSVIEMIQDSLAQAKENDRITKPKFKIVPRKVMEGNGKVYVMLAKPLDNSVKIRITLETKGAKEVPVKKRNPYTLVFVIPDELIHVQNLVNVYVWNGEDLMGISSVKCVSKLGELYSILSNIVSPYEFLCNTLGVGALSEVDAQLTTVFLKNLPKSGFNMFLPSSEKEDRFQTKEELPTLLHFAARYGLFQLVKELLECPGSLTAAQMKNARGLIPAQMANHEGHNKVAAIIDDFLMTYVHDKADIEKPIPYNQATSLDSNIKKNDPIDYYDIPAQPVPVLHLPTDRKIGNTTNERECDYMKMKGAHKENIEPCKNGFLEEHLDGMKNTCTTEKAKLSLLESQAKLIEIMEAYKKGASLTEVERMHNEWKIYYQVSDVEAKGTLDGLRNLYAKAQKAKLSKKHSSSFSELRHFLNSKLRRKESIDSKGSLSRRSSKDSNCSDRLCAEPDAIRPVSTLSVLSNTSSSSGSSFDRLSTASAGSDSGHHSDFGDDRVNKFREKNESRHKIMTGYANTVHLQRNLQSLTLNSKPPAPPPRPFKPVLHHGSLDDCLSEVPQYSVSRKLATPSFEDALKLLDYSLPNSRSSTLTNDFRTGRKTSLPFSDFHTSDDPCADYDRPPPPRPSSSLSKPILPVPSDPRTDYDLVPPPLPLSAPPQKPNDLPSVPCISPEYDFPRAMPEDNNGTQPTCTCQTGLGSVKSCCLGNKLSALKPPSVPSLDISRSRNQYCNVVPVQRDSIPEEMAPPPPVEEEHYKMVGDPIPVMAPTFKIA